MSNIQHISSNTIGLKSVSKKRILTKRQNQCLQLAAAGLTARGIARRLGITERMVHTHLREARSRLEAHSTAEAVYNALKQDILD
ncbi:MAG: response regulator transcription factor [Anaerolineaceae bacterium]